MKQQLLQAQLDDISHLLDKAEHHAYPLEWVVSSIRDTYTKDYTKSE